MNYICITGNPIKGFQFHGPFPSDHAAVDWAEKEMGLDIDWYISVLRKPATALSAEDKQLVQSISTHYDWSQIRHKDGNPRNYDIDNLEIVRLPEEISADSESYAASLPGIEPHGIEHLGEN